MKYIAILLTILVGSAILFSFQNTKYQTGSYQVSTPQKTAGALPVKDICDTGALNLSVAVPSDWDCKLQNFTDGWLTITAPTFTIQISKAGRGPYCSIVPDEDTGCKITPFYSNKAMSLDTYKTSYGSEVFGTIQQGPWIAIKLHENVNRLDLTAEESVAIKTFLESITQKQN